jgi:hypothetical protein
MPLQTLPAARQKGLASRLVVNLLRARLRAAATLQGSFIDADQIAALETTDAIVQGEGFGRS